MLKIGKKLHSKKGETIAEAMAAFVLVTMSIMMILMYIQGSIKMISDGSKISDRVAAEEVAIERFLGSDNTDGAEEMTIVFKDETDTELSSIEAYVYTTDSGTFTGYKKTP